MKNYPESSTVDAFEDPQVVDLLINGDPDKLTRKLQEYIDAAARAIPADGFISDVAIDCVEEINCEAIISNIGDSLERWTDLVISEGVFEGSLELSSTLMKYMIRNNDVCDVLFDDDQSTIVVSIGPDDQRVYIRDCSQECMSELKVLSLDAAKSELVSYIDECNNLKSLMAAIKIIDA